MRLFLFITSFSFFFSLPDGGYARKKNKNSEEGGSGGYSVCTIAVDPTLYPSTFSILVGSGGERSQNSCSNGVINNIPNPPPTTPPANPAIGGGGLGCGSSDYSGGIGGGRSSVSTNSPTPIEFVIAGGLVQHQIFFPILYVTMQHNRYQTIHFSVFLSDSTS